MLKLLTIKCFRELSYARTVQSLTLEDLQNLGLSPEDPLPHTATFHHFMKCRLGVDSLRRIMTLTSNCGMTNMPHTILITRSRWIKHTSFIWVSSRWRWCIRKELMPTSRTF
jgi:hypothetical protein